MVFFHVAISSNLYCMKNIYYFIRNKRCNYYGKKPKNDEKSLQLLNLTKIWLDDSTILGNYAKGLDYKYNKPIYKDGISRSPD